MDRAIVSIVGRPNVGKSTFFNRIIGKKVAIVDDIAGITRDRNYAEADWGGHHFYLVDTGGLVPDSGDRLEKAVGDQVRAAIAESDLILFLVDGQEGISPLDVEIADLLRRSEKPVMLVVNKVDSEVDELNAHVFSKLGLEEMWPVSANQGRNLGDLLDDLVACLPRSFAPREEQEAIKVAIVGRPNVGKSSLVNAIVGQDRVIVDAVPGTTRDSIDTPFHYKDQHYVLIDTAGLRRKARIKGRVEFYTTLRTVRSMERCDVGLLVLDAASTVADQDSRIASQLDEMSKGLMLVLNKIDLVPGEQRVVERAVRESLSYLDYAPLISVSALRGEGIGSSLMKFPRSAISKKGECWMRRRMRCLRMQ